ncbi:MAG: hypothetical protein KC613_09875, partial [Myxococcales bacterium]|nr:hypothetical protein [Myxococcales bacterium]
MRALTLTLTALAVAPLLVGPAAAREPRPIRKQLLPAEQQALPLQQRRVFNQVRINDLEFNNRAVGNLAAGNLDNFGALRAG